MLAWVVNYSEGTQQSDPALGMDHVPSPGSGVFRAFFQLEEMSLIPMQPLTGFLATGSR
jgi:hypothetical protein